MGPLRPSLTLIDADDADRSQLVQIADVPESVDREQWRTVALSQAIIDFLVAKGGVDGHQNRADLGQRKLQHDPLGNIRRPYGAPVTGLDTMSDQAACDQPRLVIQCAEGPPSFRVVVDKCFPI